MSNITAPQDVATTAEDRERVINVALTKLAQVLSGETIDTTTVLRHVPLYTPQNDQVILSLTEQEQSSIRAHFPEAMKTLAARGYNMKLSFHDGHPLATRTVPAFIGVTISKQPAPQP